MDSKMKLEELFRRWKKETGRGFVSDGIVNHDVWQATSPKVIFLMKEPNDPNGTTPWDLCQFLCKGARAEDGTGYTTTWGMTARWARGLTDGFPSWRETEEEKTDYSSADDRRSLLRRIAVVNLKKTGGGSSTKEGSLWPVVEEQQDLLKSEIEIIQPEIIVCCGTGDEFGKILFPGLSWEVTSNGTWWAARHQAAGPIAFSYYHPQARYPHHFLYTMLVDAVKEVWGGRGGS